MSDTLSGEQMQAKIQAARREAEGLKDKIKRKKDELGDTSRMLSSSLMLAVFPYDTAIKDSFVFSVQLNCL